MGRQPLARYRGTFSARREGMVFQHVCHAPTTEWLAPGVDKQLRRSHFSAYNQPSTEPRSRCFPERQGPLSAPLSTYTDADGPGRNIISAQPSQLRDSQPRADRQVQQRPIPDPFAGGGIRCIQQRLHLVLAQVWNEARVALLEWDSENAANLVQCGGLTMLQETEE